MSVAFEAENMAGAFVVTPALAIAECRCECCDEIGAVRISLAWLLWEIAIVIDFSHD